MFIKRSIIHNKGLPILCLQNINFSSIMNITNKLFKEKKTTNFKKVSYLVSYDSLTDYENQITNNSLSNSLFNSLSNSLSNSLPNYSVDFFIPIICFFSLSSIIFYFYTPKK
jgi:hypothetical protein